MYNLYLAQYENLEYPVDSFTVLLSDQIKYVSDVIGVDISIDKIAGEQWTRLVYKNHAGGQNCRGLQRNQRNDFVCLFCDGIC